MSNNYYMNYVKSMATDDECELTHVPGTQSPYYGSCPDCGLTRAPHASSLPIGIPSLVIGSILVGVAIIAFGAIKKKRRR